MQTTVDIPDELFRQAEAAVARQGGSVKDLVVQGLRLALRGGTRAKGRVQFPLIPARDGTEPLTASKVSQVMAAEEIGEDTIYARPS